MRTTRTQAEEAPLHEDSSAVCHDLLSLMSESSNRMKLLVLVLGGSSVTLRSPVYPMCPLRVVLSGANLKVTSICDKVDEGDRKQSSPARLSFDVPELKYTITTAEHTLKHRK